MPLAPEHRNGLPEPRHLIVNLLLLGGPLPRDNAHLAWCGPHVPHVPRGHPDEQVAKLNSGAKKRTHLENAIAVPKPPEHCRLVRDLLPAVTDANAEESRMRLCRNAEDARTYSGVHAILDVGRHSNLRQDVLRQRQTFARCGEA